MKSNRKRLAILAAVLALVVGIAFQSGAAKYWDGFFTNCLVKGTFHANGSDIRLGDSSSDTVSVLATMRVTDFARAATVINSYTQLSSWSGQASTNGVSWFLAEAGKAYEIDLPAINASLPGMNLLGVTVVGNDASEANNQKPFTVAVVSYGVTGYASPNSGASTVWVVPFPGSAGLTAYGLPAAAYAAAYRSACTPQSGQGDYQDTNGVIVTGPIGSGVSVAVLNKLGESASFQTFNSSGVSLVMINATVKK